MATTRKRKRVRYSATPVGRTGTTRKAIVARIVAMIQSADDETVRRGLAWYGDALDTAITVAEIMDMPIENGAAVVAAYSPQLGWKSNKEAALLFARTGAKLNGVLGESHERAQRVCGQSDPVAALNEKTGKAFKITSFAQNILGDSHAVTIDVWAIRVALGTDRSDHEKVLKRVGVYAFVAQCYRDAAAELGIEPSQAQAIAWCAVRGFAD